MNPKNEILADFEQLETEIVQTARAIANYHQELKRNRIHLELADKLTLDFARQWWTSSLGLNEQHVFMHNDLEDGEE